MLSFNVLLFLIMFLVLLLDKFRSILFIVLCSDSFCRLFKVFIMSNKFGRIGIVLNSGNMRNRKRFMFWYINSRLFLKILNNRFRKYCMMRLKWNMM